MKKFKEDLSKYFGLETGKEVYADYGNSHVYMEGDSGVNPADPIAITFENTGVTSLSSIVFFDADEASPSYSYDIITANISATLAGGKTYRGFLNFLRSNCIELMRITLEASATNTLVGASIKFEADNYTGEGFNKMFQFIRNPAEYAGSEMRTVNVNADITSITKCTLYATLDANETAIVTFYPRRITSTKKGIETGRSYTDPGNNGLNIAATPGGATRTL